MFSKILKMSRLFMPIVLLVLLLVAPPVSADSSLFFGIPGIKLNEQAAPGTNPAANMGWIYLKDLGATSALYFEDDNGDVFQLGTGATPTMDNIADPADDVTLVYADNFTALYTFADTNEDMFNIRGIGAFGNVSVVRIEQVTGAATDGQVLEVVAADTDVDPLLVSTAAAARALVVGQDTGALTLTPNRVEGESALIVTAGDILITDGDLHVDAGDALFDEDVTITGDLVGGTGLINYTHFDVDATGNMTNVSNITSDGNLIAVDGTFSGNISVVGTFNQNNLIATTADTDITLGGSAVTGGVHIGTTGGTGDIDMGAAGFATEVVLGATVNLDLAGGDLTIVDTANTDMVSLTNNTMTTASIIDIVANAVTTGKVISITADSLEAGGVMLLLDSDAIPDANTHYIEAVGAGSDWTLSKDGIAVHSGVSNTDVITVTTGNIQIDDGMMEIDTDEDHTIALTRNYAGDATSAWVLIDDTNPLSRDPALEINQDGDGAGAIGLKIVSDGDAAIIDLSRGVAADGDAIVIAMANMLDERALYITGVITGTAGEGIIEIHPTGNVAGSMIRLESDTGTPTASGWAINIADTMGDGGDDYAILINTSGNEALHVQTGVSLFVETATFTAQSVHTGGIDADGDVDIDLSANTEEVDISTTAQDFAAGSGLLQIHGDHAGNTNDMALLRLVYQAAADAEDTFIEAVDTSTGAAANGNTVFKVGTNGNITTAGTLAVNGATMVGDGATAMSGFTRPIDNSTTTLTIAMSGYVFTNTGPIEFDLPDAATGLTYTFVVGNASNLDINPQAGDTITWHTAGVGDILRSATVGDTITLFGISASTWVVLSAAPADGNFTTDTIWVDGGAGG